MDGATDAAREYLRGLEYLESRKALGNELLENMRDNLAYVQDVAQGVACIDLSGIKGTIESLEEEQQAVCNVLDEQRKALDAISPESAALLQDRFVTGQSLKAAAGSRYVSERTLQRQTNNALQELASALDQDAKRRAAG